MLKKISKSILGLFGLISLIILANVSLDNYILPKLSQYHYWSRFGWVQRVNKPVKIINKIEKVTVPDNKSLQDIASQANASVVNVVSLPENKTSVTSNLNKGKALIFSKNQTGVILTSDGLVITYLDSTYSDKILKNQKYKIVTFDGKIYDAKLVWIDNFINLIYLKIDNVSNLPSIALANSEDVLNGQKIIAISNNKNYYQNYLNAGFILGRNKTFNLYSSVVNSSDKLEGVFDIALNNISDFNSSPLINYQGELVGLVGNILINNQEKYFAISVNKIKKSFDFYLDYQENHKPRAQLGIYYLSINKFFKLANNFKVNRGALIYSPSGRQGLAVLKDMPGMRAGLKVEDIILAVDNQEVNLDNPLSNLVAQYHKGDKIKLKILRDGQEIEKEVQF